VTIFDISRHDREDACLSPTCGGKFRTGIRSDAWGHTGLVVADPAHMLPVTAPPYYPCLHHTYYL